MSSFVTIATYYSHPQAESARVLLAHEGIDGSLLNLGVVSMDWLLMNAVGGIQLQVAAQDAERASEILKAHKLTVGEKLKTKATQFVRFNCSECRAPQVFPGDRRGGVETCDKCGEYIDVPDVSDEELIEQHLTVDAASTTPDQPSGRLPLKWELAIFFVFAYIPTLLSALNWLGLYSRAENSLQNDMVLHISNMLEIVPPMLLIMMVTNEPWSKFGIQRPRWIVDSAIAVGLWLLSTYAQDLAFALMLPVEFESIETNETRPVGLKMMLLCLLGLTANSIIEEVTMRGYLIPRFEDLFRSSTVAVILSSFLFASYHVNQGVQNAISVFAFGLVYGIGFCLFRRLWPLIVAHTVSNLVFYYLF